HDAARVRRRARAAPRRPRRLQVPRRVRARRPARRLRLRLHRSPGPVVVRPGRGHTRLGGAGGVARAIALRADRARGRPRPPGRRDRQPPARRRARRPAARARAPLRARRQPAGHPLLRAPRVAPPAAGAPLRAGPAALRDPRQGASSVVLASVRVRLVATAALLAGVALVAAPSALAAPPPVAARAYVVENAATGEVLAARAQAERLPMASITKLMTVLVTLEREPLSHVVTVAPGAASVGESTVGLRAGERLSV